MNKLSRFDLGMIIAFVVVALLGGAAWYYLSGQLQAAQGDAAQAASDFDTYTKKEVYLPTASNVKTLQNNISVMTAQLDPIVAGKLQSPKSGLQNLRTVSTVDWKHDLDDEVGKLNAAAVTHGIVVPKNFYYGFSRYLNTNPTEDATPVLQRQELAIGEVANILINAPVHEIIAVRRTFEEDAPTDSSTRSSATMSGDQLPGHSIEAPGGVYTAYPFEFEFDVKNVDAFRKVVADLTASNYVFVIRSIMMQNQRLDSPKVQDLAQIAGVTDNSGTSLINSSPGAVAAAQPTVGLRYLFGDETIHIRARIDLVDWHGISHPVENETGAHNRGTGREHGRNTAPTNGTNG
jgi:hypothetical protein